MYSKSASCITTLFTDIVHTVIKNKSQKRIGNCQINGSSHFCLKAYSEQLLNRSIAKRIPSQTAISTAMIIFAFMSLTSFSGKFLDQNHPS